MTGFVLDMEQELKARQFLARQEAKYKALHPDCEVVGGAIGGAVTYEFTPTGLGTIVQIIFMRGMECEATLDLTDYEAW